MISVQILSVHVYFILQLFKSHHKTIFQLKMSSIIPQTIAWALSFELKNQGPVKASYPNTMKHSRPSSLNTKTVNT